MNKKSFNNRAVRLMLTLAVIAFFWSAFGLTAFAEEYIHGYFRYSVSDNSVTITLYTGKEREVTVPNMIAGDPVNTIAKGAFVNCEEVATIYLPDTIMAIEEGAMPIGVTVVYNGNLGETKESQESQEGQGSQEDQGSQEGQGSQETQESQEAKESQGTQKSQESQEARESKGAQETMPSEGLGEAQASEETQSVAGVDYGEEAMEADDKDAKESLPSESTEDGQITSQAEEQETDKQEAYKREAYKREADKVDVAPQESEEPAKGNIVLMIAAVIGILLFMACCAGFALWKKRKS